MTDNWPAISQLKRERPKNWSGRTSMLGLLLLGGGSWLVGDFGAGSLVSQRRLTNLGNFLTELQPFPFQSAPFNGGVFFDWVWELMQSRALEATWNTLAISISAVFLAGCGGAVLSILGARTLMETSPFLPEPRKNPWPPRFLFAGLRNGARLFMIFARAIPEYLWAFLFLAMMGPIAWPLVLALAVHNAGILGRLGAEVVENTPSPPLTGLSALGATRFQIVCSAIFPLAFSRFLLFFLYRWETCVREATVLGMLGISSLGFWIQDARARNLYDEMFFLILLGAVLVLIGDLVSAGAREWVRRQE